MGTIYEYIKNTNDKEELANLLYMVYNLGQKDSEEYIDRSDMFCAELLDTAFIEFNEFISENMLPEKDSFEESEEEILI